ncbi:hypothetical protein [Carnobacterium maltaromaticum]|uniref:hypothetical protein n=1 Tax=Carnobacterium maltaromaticum TaxID=2751 RepID=UPI0012FC4A30|nr:hypothetical protein [Carnobacterium maltaromaticum]
MIIFVLVVVMFFISSVLYRVLMEKKEVEAALLADIERLEKNYKADIEVEKERYRNQEEINKLDLATMAELRMINSDLKEKIQSERKDKVVQCEHIRELERKLKFSDERLETVLGNSFNFEKSVAESGLFEPEIQDKLRILVRTKNKRIVNKNQKAAIKLLLRCQ